MTNLTLVANNTFLNCLKEIFEDQEFRYITDKQNNVWFVGKDICDILGYANSRDVVSQLDEDEKLTSLIPTLGQNRKMTIINESGLYSLIFASTKPVAKRFKKFMQKTTDAVLNYINGLLMI